MQVSINELLVIPTRDKAYLLRVWLICQNIQSMLTRLFAHVRLTHLAQRETCVRKLFLCEPKKKICLVLRQVGRALQYPPAALRIIMVSRVVSGRDRIRPDLLSDY